MDNEMTSAISVNRLPTHQKEAILKIQGEDVKVSYSIEKTEKTRETVNDMNKSKQLNDKQTSKEEDEFKLSPSEIGYKVGKMRELFPTFDKMSDLEQTDIAAQIINGDFDDILIEDKQREIKKQDEKKDSYNDVRLKKVYGI